MIALLISLWLISGAIGYTYWWTTEHDFTLANLLFLPFVSITGPINFIAGYCIHGETRSPIVLIKKRK